jgi:hypothetical protein
MIICLFCSSTLNLFFHANIYLQMVIGQNGHLGVALTNNIWKLGLEDVTIQLQRMTDKIAHQE